LYLLLFPGILDDPAIPNFSCVSPSIDAPIVDHSQDRLNVRPSSNNGEDKSFIENSLKLSSDFFGNAKGEHSYFSSTPLSDSPNHEDVNEYREFSDLGCCDFSTSLSDHDIDSTVVNLSKTLVYIDLSILLLIHPSE